MTTQHPDSPRRVDVAVAAIVAYDRARWHQANPPQPRELPPMVAFR